MRKVLLLMAAIVIGLAANAADSATACFKVSPEMSCANCEKKIKENMRFEKGVSGVETSLSSQTVTIKYNPDKTDTANLIAGFKKIGYTATVTTEAAGTAVEKKCEKKAACDGNKACCKKE